MLTVSFADSEKKTTGLTWPSAIRHLHSSLHLERRGDGFCALAALSVLRLVCPSSRFPPLAHAFRRPPAVRLPYFPTSRAPH